MSIMDILKHPVKSYAVSQQYTESVINALINNGISCPLTDCRKANIEAYKNDHDYYTDSNVRLYLFCSYLKTGIVVMSDLFYHCP